MIGIWIWLISPCDSGVIIDNTAEVHRHDRSFSGRFAGIGKVVFWYVVAVGISLLLSKLR